MLPAMKVVTIIALVALLGIACTKAEDRKSATTAAPGDGIELISTGSPVAARTLRYHLAKGTKTPLELVLELDLEAGGRGGKMPTLVLTTDIAADEVLPDGSARIRTAVANAQARERAGSVVPASTMGAMAGQLIGTTLTATLSPDGVLSRAKVDLPKSLAPAVAAQLDQLTQNLEQIAMRLPAEPVGVGAMWSSRNTMALNGIDLVTVTTVTITAIDGDRVAFTSKTTVTTPDRTVDQQGVTMSIKDFGGGGSGAGTIDLSRMTMTGSLHSEFRGRLTAQGQTADMKMAMTLTTRSW
ncbi:MAG: hypothetical protein H6Q90_270 [Deltaproteobacteria bacterium]|nr:hypothetical protein [Deltaproteobacteria bacterium]